MRNSSALKIESVATTAPDDVLSSAKDVMKQLAEIEAKKAVDYLRKEKAEEAEKKALLDQLSKPSGLSEEKKKKSRRKEETRSRRDQPRRQERLDRSAGLLVPERALHGLRSSDQPAEARLGKYAHRPPEGNVSALVCSLASPWIQAVLPGWTFPAADLAISA
jgi:hypothetical protein